ncbi:MAG: M15 family metallopeptidase [Clostridiales bacterium]|nr:M15 family metallopeptidase [Clostridiales bacterium]
MRFGGWISGILTAVILLLPVSYICSDGASVETREDLEAQSPQEVTVIQAVPVEEETEEAQPAWSSGVSEGDEDLPWHLTLVNRDNPLPEDFQPELTDLGDGQSFDSRAVEYLEEMLEDAKAAGFYPVILSSFRTYERQDALYNKKIREYEDAGLEGEEAIQAARSIVSYPGTSEHQLGLAVDIVANHYYDLEEDQEDVPLIQWLMAHCHEYGFILRYPKDKQDITGVVYEPWHYRYVGRETAEIIMEQGITLEEYLEMYDD